MNVCGLINVYGRIRYRQIYKQAASRVLHFTQEHDLNYFIPRVW